MRTSLADDSCDALPVDRTFLARFALVNVALVVTWLAMALVVLRRHDVVLERRAKAA